MELKSSGMLVSKASEKLAKEFNLAEKSIQKINYKKAVVRVPKVI